MQYKVYCEMLPPHPVHSPKSVLFPAGSTVTNFVPLLRDNQLIHKHIHINNSMWSHYIRSKSRETKQLFP